MSPGCRQDAPGELDIRLFGRTRIFRNGVEVPVPSRQPAAVLKLLALNGGVMHPDKLVQALWPQDDSALARARVRNVLVKVRKPTGVLIQERRDSVTVLDVIRCDLLEFIDKASRAVAGIEDREATYRLGLEAKTLWAGPPLEDHRYDEWAQTPRQRAFDLRERLWAMLPSPERIQRRN